MHNTKYFSIEYDKNLVSVESMTEEQAKQALCSCILSLEAVRASISTPEYHAYSVPPGRPLFAEITDPNHIWADYRP